MKRTLSIIGLILFFACGIFAQNYIAAQIGTGTNDGLKRPAFGLTIGTDRKHTAGEVFLISLCKRDGGNCGAEVSARGTLKTKWLQGGAIATYYKVQNYDKSAFELFGGVRHGGLELNYRHDFTSPNKNRRVEVRYTKFATRHVFFRIEGYYSRFVDFYKKPVHGLAETVSVGYHW